MVQPRYFLPVAVIGATILIPTMVVLRIVENSAFLDAIAVGVLVAAFVVYKSWHDENRKSS